MRSVRATKTKISVSSRSLKSSIASASRGYLRRVDRWQHPRTLRGEPRIKIQEGVRPFPQEENVISRPQFDPRQRAQLGPRTNERIRIPEVRVIDDDGAQLGVMDTREALRIARTKDLDLVEVNPKAAPPVCKIMDFGKFKYEEAKKQREAKKKQTVVELKEIKLRPKTDDHDIDFKVKHIRRFLEEGNKVKLTVRFRGREITHPEMAQRQLDAIIEMVKDIGLVETTSRMEGRAMMAIMSPRPGAVKKPPPGAAKSKPPLPPLDDQDDDDDDDDDVSADADVG